jgi:hypothetical protein
LAGGSGWGRCVHLHGESGCEDDAEEDVVLAEDGAVGQSQKIVESGRGGGVWADL